MRNYTATQDRAIPGFRSASARATICFLPSAEKSQQGRKSRAKTELVHRAVPVRTISQSLGCQGLQLTQTSKKLVRAGCAGGTQGNLWSIASRD